ncbi:hypothetical protein QBC38DRAFT_255009 [Podospora fimiseda]|uniref:Uncharacterized protein n=1 Tax=Podospora fimiseda TaxID=252190 RepID=A0AAN7BLB4_9PEZI|nr:hypothetical protein QBC38DRAFT_255009 [Podospora fimiseda]
MATLSLRALLLSAITIASVGIAQANPIISSSSSLDAAAAPRDAAQLLVPEAESPNLTMLSSPLRLPTCTRRAGLLHTQRHWSISYDYDSYYNGMHCGLSMQNAMKEFTLCKPLTDWTCVSSGQEGLGGVTIEFHTPRTCDDQRVHEAILKATLNHIDVWCKHL